MNSLWRRVGLFCSRHVCGFGTDDDATDSSDAEGCEIDIRKAPIALSSIRERELSDGTTTLEHSENENAHESGLPARGSPATTKKKTKSDPLEAWKSEQLRLADMRIDSDQLDWEVHENAISGLDRVGGVDVSFFPDGVHAVAAIVVLSFPDLQVLYERCVTFKLSVKYATGYLAFREVPALATLLLEVPKASSPQVVLVDGNGVFHPRRCGAATHLGIVTGYPTIGVAKDVLRVGDINTKVAQKVGKGLKEASSWAPLESSADSADGPLAVLLRPSDGRKKLVVSQGHRVSLSTAITLTAALCRHSVAEPIRQADLRSREAVRRWFEGTPIQKLKMRLRPSTNNTSELELLQQTLSLARSIPPGRQVFAARPADKRWSSEEWWGAEQWWPTKQRCSADQWWSANDWDFTDDMLSSKATWKPVSTKRCGVKAAQQKQQKVWVVKQVTKDGR